MALKLQWLVVALCLNIGTLHALEKPYVFIDTVDPALLNLTLDDIYYRIGMGAAGAALAEFGETNHHKAIRSDDPRLLYATNMTLEMARQNGNRVGGDILSIGGLTLGSFSAQSGYTLYVYGNSLLSGNVTVSGLYALTASTVAGRPWMPDGLLAGRALGSNSTPTDASAVVAGLSRNGALNYGLWGEGAYGGVYGKGLTSINPDALDFEAGTSNGRSSFYKVIATTVEARGSATGNTYVGFQGDAVQVKGDNGVTIGTDEDDDVIRVSATGAHVTVAPELTTQSSATIGGALGAGTIRSNGNRIEDYSQPTSGDGLELLYDDAGDTGYVFAYDRDALEYRHVKVLGSDLSLYAGSALAMVVRSTEVRINGIFLASGTCGTTGDLLGDTGEGAKMIFYPRHYAFRAGGAGVTSWNDANIGDFSFAAGSDTVASGQGAICMGRLNSATGTDAGIFSGSYHTATGQDAVVLAGGYNNATKLQATVLNGNDCDSDATGGTIVNGDGNDIISGGDYSTLLGGSGNQCEATNAAVGPGANINLYATADYSAVFGAIHKSSGAYCMLGGRWFRVQTGADGVFAFGYNGSAPSQDITVANSAYFYSDQGVFNLCIGTTNVVSQVNIVNGSAWSRMNAGDANFTTSCSALVKNSVKYISPTDASVTRFGKLKFATYKFNGSPRTVYGLVAEDVAKVYTGAASDSVDWQRIAVEAYTTIQAQSKTIAALEKRVAALEKKTP